MSYIDEISISCGVRQLLDLQESPKEHVKLVAHYLCNLKDTFTFVLFSDNDQLGNGKKLAAYIRRNKLGTLLETPPRHNRNHPDGPKRPGHQASRPQNDRLRLRARIEQV